MRSLNRSRPAGAHAKETTTSLPAGGVHAHPAPAPSSPARSPPAQEEGEAVHAFVEEVAHQLRTPLTTLLTHAHLIQTPARNLAQNGADPDALARIVESALAIQESAERLAGEFRRISLGAIVPPSARPPPAGRRKKS